MAASNKICIKNNVVANIIYADDDFVVLLNQTGQYTSIRNQSDFPGKFIDIGYTFDGTNFHAPVPASLDAQTTVQIKIQKAILGFNELMVQYAASNVLLGITQAGKTQLIADALDDAMRYGQCGSLYACIAALQAIVITPEMSPYLTSSVITSLIQQATNVINSL